MRSFRHLLILLPALTLLSTPFTTSSWASRFTNQFVEFELPPQWQCSLEGAEWVCQNADSKKKTDGIIVLAAKMKGDSDSLDQYRSYLKNAKVFTAINGKQLKSDVKYVKDSQLRDAQPWVDALHYESELPEFYTRYLATIKEDMGVLVTYSINKMKYQVYANDFDAMVNTLKVFRKSGPLNAGGSQGGNLFDQAKIPAGVAQETVFGGIAPTGGTDTPQQTPAKQEFPLTLIIGAAVVVGIIIFLKKRSSSG